MTPAEIDAALLAWLPRRGASSVKPELRWRKRDEQDLEYSESFIASYDCAGGFGEGDTSEALRTLERLNARADKGDCVKEVVRLKALTVNRAAGEDDMAVQIAAMAEELSAYPLDVVRDACRTWAANGTFFPSWAELRELCEERVLKRRCLLKALQRYFAHKTAEQDPGAASDQAGTAADSTADAGAREPYNTLWKSKQRTLEQAVGTKAYNVWLKDLIPVAPCAGAQDACYQLGAPTRFMRDFVASNYAEVVEQVLGRGVRLIVFDPKNPAHRASSSP